MRVSLACFIATALVFVLQWVPVTGFFLMFLMAPLWSVVLINVGFIAMAFEVRVGTLPRWALAFPVLYFGGYYTVAVYQHVAVSREIAALVSTPSNPQKLDLKGIAVETDFSTDEIAHDLLTFYNVPAAVHRSNNGGLALVYRKDSDCKRSLVSKYDTSKLAETLRHSLISDPCISHRGEVFDEPTVKIKPGVYRRDSASGAAEVQIAVTTPDGTRITIDNGWLSALSWFPMPILGCGLNDGKSTWDCRAFFGHDIVNLLSPVNGVTGAAFAVAKVLGLQRAQIE